MSSSAQIVSLINQIRGTTSPLQRVKLVALAWRTLRGLGRAEQLAVAKEIGLEGAEKLVEKLADRSGVSPADLLGAIRKAEGKGITTISKVNEVFEELIPEEPGRTIGPAIATPPPITAKPPPPRPNQLDAEPEASAYELLPPFPDTPAPVAPPAPQPEPSSAPARPRAAVSKETERRPTPVPSTQRAAERPAPAPEHARPQKAATAPMEGKTADIGLIGDLAATGSLLRRLRQLTRRVAEADWLDLEQLQQLLELFPSGWSRRRAFEELVRSGVLTRLDDMLMLVERTLASTTERLWALTTLQRQPEIGPESREQLLAAAAEPMIRRRLQRRLARTGARQQQR